MRNYKSKTKNVRELKIAGKRVRSEAEGTDVMQQIPHIIKERDTVIERILIYKIYIFCVK